MKAPHWMFALLTAGSVGCQLIAGIDDRSLAPEPDASIVNEGTGGTLVNVADSGRPRRDASTLPKDSASDVARSDGALSDVALLDVETPDEGSTDAHREAALVEAGDAAADAPRDVTVTPDAPPDVTHVDAEQDDAVSPIDDVSQPPEPDSSDADPDAAVEQDASQDDGASQPEDASSD